MENSTQGGREPECELMNANIKYPQQANVLNAWSPASFIIWGGCETLGSRPSWRKKVSGRVPLKGAPFPLSLPPELVR